MRSLQELKQIINNNEALRQQHVTRIRAQVVADILARCESDILSALRRGECCVRCSVTQGVEQYDKVIFDTVYNTLLAAGYSVKPETYSIGLDGTVVVFVDLIVDLLQQRAVTNAATVCTNAVSLSDLAAIRQSVQATDA